MRAVYVSLGLFDLRVWIDLWDFFIPHSVRVQLDYRVRRRLSQVSDRFRLEALEVYMPALGFLFLPRHVDERPLDVVVYDLCTTSWPFADFLFVCWVAFNS